MSTLGVRVKEAREKIGLSQPKLAEAVGVSTTTVQHIESNRNRTTKYLPQFADALHVRLDWLAYGRGEPDIDWKEPSFGNASSKMETLVARMEDGEEPRKAPVVGDDAPGYTFVGKANLRASLGAEIDAQEYEHVVDRLAFRTDWIISKGLDPNRLALIACRGDSMEPTLMDGDLVLADLRRNQPWMDGLYAVRINGAIRIKRVRTMKEGAVEIISDNRERYDPETFSRDEAGLLLHNIGRIVWVGRELI